MFLPSLLRCPAALVLLFAFLFFPRPVQAQTPGHWKLDRYECSGAAIIIGGGDEGIYSYDGLVLGRHDDGSSSGILHQISSAVSSYQSLSVTPVFQWIPGTDQNAQPTVLTALISSEAFGGDADDPAFPVSAENGFGDSSPAPQDYSDSVVVCAWSSGTHLERVDPHGQTTLRLPRQTLFAAGGVSYSSRSYSTLLFYQAKVASAPKSILINRPENTFASNVEKDKYVMGANGEWSGYGDSRFSNDVTSDTGGEAGSSLDYEDWTCGFVGAPWPPDGVPQLLGDLLTADGSDYYRNWAWYAEATPTTGSLGSDSGDTFSIHKFTPQIRPHVEWPYAQPAYDPTLTVYLPHDLLDEMTSPQAPSPQKYRVNLHLADTPIWATQDTHPDWKFDQHSNFNITYHNEYELIATQPTDEVPTAENPWKPVVCNTGTVFQDGQQNENIITEGYYADWSPSFYYQADSNYNVTVTAVYVNGGVGQSTAVGLYRPVPPRTVPRGMIGVVYYHPYIIRCPFTYRQYSVAGRILPGLGNDAQGNELPFSSYVDRSAGGFGVNNIVTKIFLVKRGAAFPDKIEDDDDPAPIATTH